MLSPLSNINAVSPLVGPVRPLPGGARTETAAAALAALSPAQPGPQVANSLEDAGETGPFLYGPRGMPAGEPAPAAVSNNTTSGSSPAPRLAMESGQLTALLSSLMAPGSAAAESHAPAVPQPAAPATAEPSLITRLYQQF